MIVATEHCHPPYIQARRFEARFVSITICIVADVNKEGNIVLMLDDLKLIHTRDAQDALGVVEKQGKQLLHDFGVTLPDLSGVDNVVYAGMGGSALAARVSLSWPGYTVPFEIVRDYSVPGYVGPKTLVIVASYSGNTEEALSALNDAEGKGAKIVVIAGGGALREVATAKNLPLLLLPKAEQPRYAVLYNLKALLLIAQAAQVLPGVDLMADLARGAAFVEAVVTAWAPMSSTAHNQAKQLALEVIGKSAVVYAGPFLAPAAYKWKISFNENAKNVAWFGQYPEFNHNEFMGWSSHPLDKPYAVIDLRSSYEHERIRKRFELSAKLLSGRRPAPLVVEAQGSDKLEHLLWTLVLGDFVTIYTGILNGLNPAPVDLVERFKKELAT